MYRAYDTFVENGVFPCVSSRRVLYCKRFFLIGADTLAEKDLAGRSFC